MKTLPSPDVDRAARPAVRAGRVSGRVTQLSLAVALAPFAVLTALFVGGEPA